MLHPTLIEVRGLSKYHTNEYKNGVVDVGLPVENDACPSHCVIIVRILVVD